MLSVDVLLALVVFALVSSLTPGPNNLMLLASGLNFGFKKTLPHMFGVSFGFAVLLLAIGLGVAQLITIFPGFIIALKIVGGGYLTYLAYRIATAVPASGDVSNRRPMSFWAAVAFQWVNVKAWFMSVGAMAAFTDPANFLVTVVLVTLVFTMVNLPSIALWTGFGLGLRRVLQNPRWFRWFNYLMAALLMLSLIPMLS